MGQDGLDTGVFVALINPGMSLVFSATFFLLWRHRPEQRYIGLLSLSFLALGIGFALLYFTLYSITFSRLLSNLLLIAGAAGFALGSLSRLGRRPPLRALGIVTGIGFAVFLWFLYVDHDITMRIYAINFTVAAIMLVMAVEMRKARAPKLIDKLLSWQLYFWSATFVIRPLVVVWIDGPYEDYATFHDSLYWITLIYSASLFLLLFPLMQITAIALDVMDALKRDSFTDSLSGLLNRRGFEDGAKDVLRQVRRRSLPVSIILCDLDRFKAINDTYGHACGDEVIVEFARCLRRVAGPDHLAGRLGGEEFAILLEGATLATARLVAEKIRASLSGSPISGLPAELRVSASFGIAEQEAREELGCLLRRADAALYDAKKTGRDRVAAFRPELLAENEKAARLA